MTRGSKKIFYGCLFALCLFLFASVIFLNFIKKPNDLPEQSFKGEDGIGEAIQIHDTGYFVNEGKVYGYAEFFNPNEEWWTPFVTYRLRVLDKDGKEAEAITGDLFNFGPKSRRFVYGAEIRTPLQNIGRIDVLLIDMVWEAGDSFINREASFELDEVTVGDRLATVRGTIKNTSAFMIPKMEVVVIFRDSSGFKYFITGTFVEKIGEFSSRDFRISLSLDDYLLNKFQSDKIDVYIYQL